MGPSVKFHLTTAIINLSRDHGRRQHLNPMQRYLKADWWPGEDRVTLSPEGVILDWPARTTCIEAAKEAKIKLFQEVLSHRRTTHLLLLEDDLVVHQKFKEGWEWLKSQLPKLRFDLLYLGLSTPVEDLAPPTCSSDSLPFQIYELPKVDHPYSGAYGVILSRSILQQLVLKFQHQEEKLIGQPFDDYYLGGIQAEEESRCLILQPHLVVPLITTSNIRARSSQEELSRRCGWDRRDYLTPRMIPLIVITHRSNQHRLPGLFRSFQQTYPILRILIIAEEKSQIPLSEVEVRYFKDDPGQVILRLQEKYSELLITTADTRYLISPESEFLPILTQVSQRARQLQHPIQIRFPIQGCPHCQNPSPHPRYLQYLYHPLVENPKPAYPTRTLRQVFFYDVQRCLELEAPAHQVEWLDLRQEQLTQSSRLPFLQLQSWFQCWHQENSRQKVEEILAEVGGNLTQLTRSQFQRSKPKLLQHHFTLHRQARGVALVRRASSWMAQDPHWEHWIQRYGESYFELWIPVNN